MYFSFLLNNVLLPLANLTQKEKIYDLSYLEFLLCVKFELKILNKILKKILHSVGFTKSAFRLLTRTKNVHRYAVKEKKIDR